MAFGGNAAPDGRFGRRLLAAPPSPVSSRERGVRSRIHGTIRTLFPNLCREPFEFRRARVRSLLSMYVFVRPCRNGISLTSIAKIRVVRKYQRKSATFFGKYRPGREKRPCGGVCAAERLLWQARRENPGRAAGVRVCGGRIAGCGGCAACMVRKRQPRYRSSDTGAACVGPRAICARPWRLRPCPAR